MGDIATPDPAWEARLSAHWATLGAQSPGDFIAGLDVLLAELGASHPVALFERGAALDSTGRPAEAVPLYEAALAAGVTGLRRRRAVIQRASSLRSLGEPQRAADALETELREQPDDELSAALRGFLALTWIDLGREREAAALAIGALAPLLPRYQRSLGRYAAQIGQPAEAPPRRPVVLMPGEGRAWPMGPLAAVFKADEAETASKYSISEWWLEPHTRGPGTHQHPEDDVFYVIEGVMSLRVDAQWFDCPKGAFVLVPGGVPHDFENRGEQRAGVLNLSVPGPFEPHMAGIADWFRARSPQDSRA